MRDWFGSVIDTACFVGSSAMALCQILIDSPSPEPLTLYRPEAVSARSSPSRGAAGRPVGRGELTGRRGAVGVVHGDVAGEVAVVRGEQHVERGVRLRRSADRLPVGGDEVRRGPGVSGKA